jgi:hypothetical protein
VGPGKWGRLAQQGRWRGQRKLAGLRGMRCHESAVGLWYEDLEKLWGSAVADVRFANGRRGSQEGCQGKGRQELAPLFSSREPFRKGDVQQLCTRNMTLACQNQGPRRR